MSDPQSKEAQQPVPAEEGSAHPAASEADLEPSRGVALVWLVPLLAAVVGAGIAWDTVQSRGPEVKLVFRDGSGLEAGKTRIKYRAIEIGLIESLRLADDLGSVIATARMEKDAQRYLKSDTVFWRVTPRVSLAGISGLDTLLSGSYVALLPAAGEPRFAFDVLDEPPPIAQHRDALMLELTAEELGTLGVASPVTYRSVKVGEVLRHQLDESGKSFKVQLMIYREFAHLVRKGSEFWNTSGFAIDIDSTGVHVDVASLASILVGGVSFDTPAAAWDSEEVESGATFSLHDDFQTLAEARSRSEGVRVLVEAQSADGLREGAPIFYRKLEVGRVGRPELSEDATTVRTEVHIERRFADLLRENSRFWTSGGVDFELGAAGLSVETPSVAELLSGGLEFATPDRLGKRARNGHLFALHEEPESDWLAWAPRIHIEGEQGSKVVHAIDPDARAHKSVDLVLESFTAASLNPGDPIYYREVQVGTIGAHSLSPDSRTVRIDAHVDERYATLVRQNSRFWNVSGVNVSMGLTGIKVRTGGLTSVLSGGVAFATPEPPGDAIASGALFPLYPEAEDRWLAWSPDLWIEPPGDTPVEHAIGRNRARGIFPPSEPAIEAVMPSARPAGERAVPASPAP